MWHRSFFLLRPSLFCTADTKLIGLKFISLFSFHQPIMIQLPRHIKKSLSKTASPSFDPLLLFLNLQNFFFTPGNPNPNPKLALGA